MKRTVWSFVGVFVIGFAVLGAVWFSSPAVWAQKTPRMHGFVTATVTGPEKGEKVIVRVVSDVYSFYPAQTNVPHLNQQIRSNFEQAVTARLGADFEVSSYETFTSFSLSEVTKRQRLAISDRDRFSVLEFRAE